MEKLLYVLRQLTNELWLIDPQAIASYFPILRMLAEGRVAEFIATYQAAIKTEAPSLEALPVAVHGSIENRTFANTLEEAPKGSKSLIRLEGTVMKKDFCGAMGTETIGRLMQEADRHPNINGHMIITDSPGGSVDGTKALADIIAQLEKPVLVFVDQLAASAAYWIASAATEIVAINETALIGSVGTMIRLRDNREGLAANGITDHTIVADGSEDKNRVYTEALDSNYKPIKTELLNPLNQIFHDSVKANRPGIKEEALTGKVYLAADAVKMGLIDHVGNFDFAIERLEALTAQPTGMPATGMPATGMPATKKTLQVQNQQEAGPELSIPASAQTENSTMFTKNKFPLLTGLTSAADEATLNAVNEELEANGIKDFTIVQDSTLATYESDAQAAQQRIDSLNTDLAEMTAERDEALALAKSYGAKPGASHSEASREGGDELEETEAQKSQKEIDALPHNQAVDNSLLFK